MDEGKKTSAFHVENLTVRFDTGLTALSAFNLDAKMGERICLLGPSGCGKSTVLRVLAGLQPITEGRVWLPNSQENAIGFVFQEASLMPWATVIDNIALPLKLKGVSKDQRHGEASRLVTQVGLNGFELAYPSELSGGMKMRVSVARALIAKPDLLLMDEPFAALDEISRFSLNDLLLDLQSQQDFTLLFVTHSIYESAYMANRIVVLSDRPAMVKAEIATGVDGIPDPEFRQSTAFIELCRKVSDALN